MLANCTLNYKIYNIYIHRYHSASQYITGFKTIIFPFNPRVLV